MTTSINNAITDFEGYKVDDEEIYTNKVGELGSEAYNKASDAMALYENIKTDQYIAYIDAFDYVNAGGSNIIEKYTAFTELCNQQFLNFESLQEYVKGEINAALQDENLRSEERSEVQEMIDYVNGDESIFKKELETMYEEGTVKIIEMDNLPTGIFIISHENFKDQIENFTKTSELDQWWATYLTIYEQAMSSLDAMLEIAQGSDIGAQTPVASSAIVQYQTAIASSVQGINKRAQTKRAKMCQADNYMFLIILFVILLLMVGVGVWCNNRKHW